MNDKLILRDFSYGMYLIGAKKEKLAGFIADAVMQISGDPVTIAISVNKDNYTHGAILESKKFSISILDEQTDANLIRLFGYQSSKDVEKYDKINYNEVDGIPVYNNSCGYIICDVINVIDGGTHTIFLGKAITMKKEKTTTPMTYKYYHETLKGNSSPKAPTYVEDQEEVVITNDNKIIWHCTVCGYEIELDELPGDFVCPWCKMGKDVFIKK